jgi:phosphate starvation-inducible protein PhoH
MPLHQQQRLTKKQKRLQRQQGDDFALEQRQQSFTMSGEIRPMTDNQRIAFEHWDDGYSLMLHGIAGTGKTFLGLYFALKEVVKPNSQYNKVYIVRSTVSTRDQGFLPGSLKEKAKVFESPYVPICTKLYGRGDAYEILKGKGYVEFITTSYLRGETFDNCILLVDEVQNMGDGELHTVMTRVGENCRIIFCGDVKQDDLTSERKKELSGLRDFMKILHRMKEFEFVDFQVEDIVRSALVRSYIIERNKLGL